MIETNKDTCSTASSATIYVVKNKASSDMSSSEEVVDLEIEEKAERAEENWSLKRGYEWVDYQVRKYFSCYRWFSALCSFLSNIFVYYPEATEEIIYFWRCAIDNVCHGRENETCEFLLFL